MIGGTLITSPYAMTSKEKVLLGHLKNIIPHWQRSDILIVVLTQHYISCTMRYIIVEKF